MPEKQPGLHAKLAEVAAAVERIPKTGHNDKQNYDFVETGVVADTIRKELAARHVTMAPETIDIVGDVDIPISDGRRQRLLTILVTWRITDADSGETLTRQSLGEGADSLDKASYKAQTGAMKYALLTGFLLGTGDDPEKEPPRGARTAQAPRNAPQRPSAPPRPSAAPSAPPKDWDEFFVANPPPAESPAPVGLTHKEFGAWLDKARIPPATARDARLRLFPDVAATDLTSEQWLAVKSELEPLAI